MAYTENGYECNSGCGFGVTFDDDERGNLKTSAKVATVDAHMDQCMAEQVRRSNMRLIYDYVMGKRGTRKQQDAVVDAVWALQDGYGVAGFTPAQGFDWSGIRDSTPDTVEAMAQEVRRIVQAASSTAAAAAAAHDVQGRRRWRNGRGAIPRPDSRALSRGRMVDPA